MKKELINSKLFVFVNEIILSINPSIPKKTNIFMECNIFLFRFVALAHIISRVRLVYFWDEGSITLTQC